MKPGKRRLRIVDGPEMAPAMRGTRSARFRALGTTSLKVGVPVVALAACSTTEFVSKAYGGPPRPDAEIAVIALGDAIEARIGDRRVSPSDYARVQLLPGRHHVAWQCLYGVSVMIEPSGWVTDVGDDNVELKAGHVYSLHCDRTTRPGYQTYQWIHDDTAGEIVAGAKKP
jgi:hypothetical protein